MPQTLPLKKIQDLVLQNGTIVDTGLSYVVIYNIIIVELDVKIDG